MSAKTDPDDTENLKQTPLHSLHIELGGKMVPFAGYEMPVQYPPGIMAEHLHTRENAGLFDVSHMGQAVLVGPDHETTASALEALTPGNIKALGPGRMRYTVLLNDQGGIIDDLMVTRPLPPEDDGRLMLIVNAARKQVDYEHIRSRLPADISLEIDDTLALLALQGPKAAEVLAVHCKIAQELQFMAARSTSFDDIACHITRSGYTGEDGYEISVAGNDAQALARTLLKAPEVEPIGLGARDSLRLEAGLCLYGHDIDETTSPVEAGLNWIIGKRRREEGGFPGAARILRELEQGPARKRVGIKPSGRAPAREGTVIVSKSGKNIGIITSGGYGPTVQAPVAMGYVEPDHSSTGTKVDLMIRGKAHPAEIADLPFTPHRYARPDKK